MPRHYPRSLSRFMMRRRRIKRRKIKRRKIKRKKRRTKRKRRRRNIARRNIRRRRRSTKRRNIQRIRRSRSRNGLFVGIPFLKMFLKCSKCNNVFRICNAEKHIKHCKNAAALCCDCGVSLSPEEISKHTDCPNALKRDVPPLYNPKAVCFSLGGLWCRKYLIRISATFFLLIVLHSKTKIASWHPFSTNLCWWIACPERRMGL